MAVFFTLFSEIEKFFRTDIEGVTDVKNHVQGNCTVCGFNPAHMGATDIHQFSQFALRYTPLLSVVCNIETQAFIFVVLPFFHDLTPN